MIEATHKKMGNRHRVLYYGIDCTRAKDGTQVVVYANENMLDIVYVMDRDEFERQFNIQ